MGVLFFLWKMTSSFICIAEVFTGHYSERLLSFSYSCSMISLPPPSKLGTFRSILVLVFTFLNSEFGLRNDVTDILIFVSVCFSFETGSYYILWAGLELTVILLSPKFWNSRCVPPCLLSPTYKENHFGIYSFFAKYLLSLQDTPCHLLHQIQPLLQRAMLFVASSFRMDCQCTSDFFNVFQDSLSLS